MITNIPVKLLVRLCLWVINKLAGAMEEPLNEEDAT